MSLRGVDLNLLVTLDALLRERNVTRAGKRVGLSQPAVSAALARLRQTFADPLLVRVGREYRLTPRARDLAAPLQAALSSLEQTLDGGAAFDHASAQQEFRIACSDYTMLVFLQPVIARLSHIAPGVRLHLRVADSSVGRQLANGQVDLSIQPVGVLGEFSSLRLFSDSWVCAVWRGNTQVSDQLTHAQWCSLPHATFGYGRSGISLGDLQLGSFATERTRALVCGSFLALPLLLRETQLVALLPRRLAELLQSAGDLRFVKPPLDIPEFAQAMTWSPAYTSNAAHAWFRELLVQMAQAL
jgi:DNA-binding transcriptional LysR family regulator